MSYVGLSRAALSFEYLHTNSTTHEFLFGALAELIDNSKDANSKKIDIYTVRNDDLRGGYMLCFLDDGEGMGRDDAHHVIRFGRSAKKAMDQKVIGQYGNGLKSGAMRVAKDFIVFTKQKGLLTCIFMSRTFHEEEKIEEVIVPIPTWDEKSRTPSPSSPEDLTRHSQELEIILRYSPFKSEADLFEQFDKIETENGTLVILMNMKLLDNGEPELDVTSDPTDIIMGSEKGLTHEGLVLERRSLRAYTSILYLEPRMKIYIQGVKVQTRRLANCLYKPKQFKFTSTRFKTRAENDAREAREHAKHAEERAREAESKHRDLIKRVGSNPNRDIRSKLNLAKNDAEDKRADATYKSKLADTKEKLLKDPKILHLIFGFNIENRSCDGMFMYNCGRLIKMYERTGPQLDGGLHGNGVVGIVDVPYMVLQPAHNKQDFADGKEYRHLLKVMGEHLIDYWNDSEVNKKGASEFWEDFGYLEGKDWSEPPSCDQRYLRKRQMTIPQAIQCDMCLKWRLLPAVSANVGKKYPPNWVCTMNPDASYNRCNAPEQKFSFPLLDKKKLQKDQASKDEEKPQVVRPTELPSFGRTILEKPAQMPVMKVFKPAPVPVIAPTRMNAAPKLLPSKKPQPPSPASSREETSRQAKLHKRAKSPSPEPPPPKSSRISAPPVRRKKSPSPPPRQRAKSVVSSRKPPPALPSHPPLPVRRRSPTPEPPKRARRKSPSPDTAPAPAAPRNMAKRTPAGSSTRPNAVRRRSPSPESPAPRVTTSRQQAVAASKEAIVRKETQLPDSSAKDSDERVKSKFPAQSTSSDKRSEDEDSESGSVQFKLGQMVQALHAGDWVTARVLEVNPSSGKLKLKFPGVIPDKWMPPADVKPCDDNEQPVTTTAASVSHVNAGSAKILENLKSVLRYFQPPTWNQTESIDNLTLEELESFPLDDFYKQYESGLRRLIDKQKKTEVNKYKAELQSQAIDKAQSEFGAWKNIVINHVRDAFPPERCPSNDASIEEWAELLRSTLNRPENDLSQDLELSLNPTGPTIANTAATDNA